MTKIQKNLSIVLGRIIKLADQDEDFAECFAEDLEHILDSIASDDGFGTERQCDPRGDFRVKEWSLFSEVQQ